MKRFRFYAIKASAIVLGFLVRGNAMAETKTINPVVLELFTSQGCSSCPPADAIAARLADRDDVIVLSYHVDYWDYLGWKDPLSSPASSNRQRQYSRWLRSSKIYTPQVVVNGQLDVLGSDESALERGITSARREANSQPQVSVKKHGDRMEITVSAGAPQAASVLLVAFVNSTETKISRGENAGRTLVQRHSVVNVSELGKWNGTLKSFSAAAEPGYDYAVLVQRYGTGEMIGAGQC